MSATSIPAPVVSIVIVNYNGDDYLTTCLHSVLKTTSPRFEIILVDNASSDGSMDSAERMFGNDPRITFLKNEVNLGFSSGNNVGFAKSKGEYVVFLNNDVIVQPDWLIELVRPLQEDQTIGAAQSKLLLLRDRGRLDSAGDFIDTLGFPFSRGQGEIDTGRYDDDWEIFSARGAAMIVKRDVFADVGGFDSLLFMRGEDLDLSWRIRLRGYRIALASRSIVYHASGIASSKLSPSFMASQSARGYLLMTTKNYSDRNLVRRNPIIILIASIVIDVLIRTDASIVRAKTVALLWYILKFRAIYRKRQGIQVRLRKINDQVLMVAFQRSSITEKFRAALKANRPPS